MDIYGIPIKCDIEDLNWIKDQLSKIPNKHLVNGVINKYSEVYQTAEGGTCKQLGAARRNANSRLRVYVCKLLEGQR